VTGYGRRYESVLDSWSSDAIYAISTLVSQPQATCIVFGNADSGEGFITVDGNWGDRNNLTLWQNGDEVIRNVSSMCNNTIVVLHTVGPVLVNDWYDNPNITAIIWAGLPGQESGNSLVDILWGKVNPAGRSPFTSAKQRKTTRPTFCTNQTMATVRPNRHLQRVFTSTIVILTRWGSNLSLNLGMGCLIPPSSIPIFE
jgi:beta-glucosidase